jgi:hypothetical protein
MRCCFFPGMNAAAENGTDAATQNCTSDNPKSATNGLHNEQQDGNGAHEQNKAAPISPLTPSPRQTGAAWQRPEQRADATGQASTSQRDERDTCLRWVINISQWTPWDDEWLFLLDLLPEQDQKEVRPWGGLFIPETVGRPSFAQRRREMHDQGS